MNLQEQASNLTIQPRRVVYFLAITEIVLLVFSLIGQYLRNYPNPLNVLFPQPVHYFIVGFDINAEANFPTMYSVSMALASAFLFFFIAYFKHKEKDSYRFHWTVLGWFLLYISMDDASVIHEKTSKYLKGFSNLGGWFEYRWLMIGLVVVAVMGVSFFRFWLSLDPKYKILFIVSAGLFFGGAMGVEMIGGKWAASFGSRNFIYTLFTTLEQGLQYVGLIMLVYSLLLYIRSYLPSFNVSAAE